MEQKDLPTEANSDTTNSNPSNENERSYPLPQSDYEIIQMQKSGAVTIPKEIREEFTNQPSFAFWKDKNRLIFQLLTKEELKQLELIKEEEARAAQSTKGSKKPKSRATKPKKTTTQQEPELTKYFPYMFEKQNEMKKILENTFYHLMDSTPDVEAALERIKYGIINFATGKKTNDSRLKHSVIIFITDVLNKNPNPDLNLLIDFAYTKILPTLSSRFLQEQSQIEIFLIAIKRNQQELAHQLLHEILNGIERYSENYAIMQGFKNLIRPLSTLDNPLIPELKTVIGEEIVKFIHGFTHEPLSENQSPITHAPLNTDKTLELIELLQELHLIELAYHETEELLNRIPPEDIYIQNVREKLSELKSTKI